MFALFNMAVATSTLLIGATLAATAASAYGQYSAGQAQSAIAQRNAAQSKAAAETSFAESRENARRQRDNNKSALSRVRALAAGSGVVISTGAPLEILGETAARLELSVLDQGRSDEARRAALASQGDLQLWEGQQAATAGMINAGGTLLSGASQAYGMYGQSRRSGTLLKG